MRSSLKIKVGFLVTLFALAFTLGTANADNTVSITVDGRTLVLDQPGVMIGSRVMVPLRGVFENLGATVDYNPGDRSIRATRGNSEVTLSMGSHLAIVNGESRSLDVAPLSLNSRILVPLRFTSEALGADVHWMAYTQTVDIQSRTGGSDTFYPPSQHKKIAHLINSVSVSSRSVGAGQDVTVTVIGSAGGDATMAVGGRTIVMSEVSSGHYVGTLTAPSSYAGKNLDVSVTLQMPNGRIETIHRARTIQVLAP